eukprot:TRINITY_DN1241_c0_g1_i3.p1 TRINITY_DN1241_c0_g1~~TRINITY_DN1241_c0_g1_i3.p1  ORF type:complete len:706 (+),score=161.14 TRINITY_DN1241_c0_g1_i3:112-2118(+)
MALLHAVKLRRAVDRARLRAWITSACDPAVAAAEVCCTCAGFPVAIHGQAMKELTMVMHAHPKDYPLESLYEEFALQFGHFLPCPIQGFIRAQNVVSHASENTATQPKPQAVVHKKMQTERTHEERTQQPQLQLQHQLGKGEGNQYQEDQTEEQEQEKVDVSEKLLIGRQPTPQGLSMIIEAMGWLTFLQRPGGCKSDEFKLAWLQLQHLRDRARGTDVPAVSALHKQLKRLIQRPVGSPKHHTALGSTLRALTTVAHRLAGDATPCRRQQQLNSREETSSTQAFALEPVALPLAPLPLVSSELDSFLKRYCGRMLTPEQQSERFAVAGTIQDVVAQRASRCRLPCESGVPCARVYVYGSSVTGCATASDDLDLVVHMPHFSQDGANGELQALRFVQRALNDAIGHSFLLIHARVPVLRQNRVCRSFPYLVDITANRSLNMLNSCLLRDYFDLDPRVAPFVFVVKSWAKQFAISDQSKGQLSSYTWSLLALFFLQVRGVLPCLQRRPASAGADAHGQRIGGVTLEGISCYWYRSGGSVPDHDEAGLAQLICDFWRFYGSAFDFCKYCVSVRTGVPLPRAELVQARTDQKQWLRKPMLVEDPFEERNLTAHITPRRLAVIVECMRRCAAVACGPEPLTALLAFAQQPRVAVPKRRVAGGKRKKVPGRAT